MIQFLVQLANGIISLFAILCEIVIILWVLFGLVSIVFRVLRIPFLPLIYIFNYFYKDKPEKVLARKAIRSNDKFDINSDTVPPPPFSESYNNFELLVIYSVMFFGVALIINLVFFNQDL